MINVPAFIYKTDFQEFEIIEFIGRSIILIIIIFKSFEIKIKSLIGMYC